MATNEIMAEDYNWSEKSYTLVDIDNLCIQSCIVKITQEMELQSFLDLFVIKSFKNLFSVQAFKMNSNEDITDVSTYGEEVAIPMSYEKHGSIIPLYGVSHIFKTVEEMIMAFPRFVEVQEDLTFCSQNCLVHLKSGERLELLKVEKTDSTSDNLLCENTETKVKIYLNASSIGRFKSLPDLNTYTIKDVLKILKLPQIIKFERNSNLAADLQGAESNLVDNEYSGLYLLVGLRKSRAAVITHIFKEDKNDDDSSGYILSLDSDLFKYLKYHFAFKNDLKSIKICESSYRDKKLDKDSQKTVKKFSEEDTGSASAPAASHNLYKQIVQPLTARKFPSGEKITKKINTTIQLMKTKLKKTPSKEFPTICKDMTPESTLQLSKRLYPSLFKIKLTPEANENVYYDAADIALEGKSRFFSSAYATINPDIVSNTATKALKPGNKSKELSKIEEKSKVFNDNVRGGTDEEFCETPPPIPKRSLNYNKLYLGKRDSLYKNSDSTLKVSGRSGLLEYKNNSQTGGKTLMDKADVQTDHFTMVNSDMVNLISENDGINVHNKMVNKDGEAETDKVDSVDRYISDGVIYHNAELQTNIACVSQTVSYDTNGKASSTASTMEPTPEGVAVGNSSEDKVKVYDEIGNLSSSPIAPKPVARHRSNPIPPPKPSKQLPTPVLRQNSSPTPPPRQKSFSTPPSKKKVLANRPPLPIPQPKPSSTTPPQTASSSTAVSPPPTTTTTETINPSGTLHSTGTALANRPPLPTPQPKPSSTTPPQTTSSSTAVTPPPTTETATETTTETTITETRATETINPSGTLHSTGTALANRPPLPIPQPKPSSTTPPQTTSSSTAVTPPPSTETATETTTTETRATETINPSGTLHSTGTALANRPPLPIPQPKPSSTTPPQTTSSSTAVSPPPTTASASPKHKPEESTEISLSSVSVKELCMLLENCGLHKLKDICQENCLDGFFLSKLSDSSLQAPPFNVSSIELIKLKMMFQGWRPKME